MSRMTKCNSSSANYRLGKYADDRKYEQMSMSNVDMSSFERKPYYGYNISEKKKCKAVLRETMGN